MKSRIFAPLRAVLRTVAAVAVIAVIAATASSCGGKENKMADKVRLERVSGFRVKGLTSYEVDVVVANDSRIAFKLMSAAIDIYCGSIKVGEITSTAEVKVPKRATSTVTLPLSLGIENPIALYGAYNRASRGDIGAIHFDVRARVKALGISREFTRSDIRLKDLMEKIGVDVNDLKKLIKL